MTEITLENSQELIDDLTSVILYMSNRNSKLHKEVKFLRDEIATLEEENGILEDELDNRDRYRGCLA